MLVVRNEAHLAAVRAFADRMGQRDQLEQQLAYLDTYGCRRDDGTIDRTRTQCILVPDPSPQSFEFMLLGRDPATGEYVYWFVGGLLWHGPPDGCGSGDAPTFATTLTPAQGWRIHT